MDMKQKLSLLKYGLAAGAAVLLIASSGVRADVVTDWNAIAANLPIAAPPATSSLLSGFVVPMPT